jgi:hypothetical protein
MAVRRRHGFPAIARRGTAGGDEEPAGTGVPAEVSSRR